MKTLVMAAALVMTAALSTSTTTAAEIKVISSVGVKKTALDDMRPQFEKYPATSSASPTAPRCRCIDRLSGSNL